MEDQRPGVAIIGLVARYPGAENADQLWENLAAGREAIHRFDLEELRAAGTAEALLGLPNFVPVAASLRGIEQFDASFFGYSPREAELMDPQFRLFLEASWEALESAGHDPTRFDGRVGIYAGASVGGYFLNNVLGHRRLIEMFGGMRIGVLNLPDHLPTVVAYKLDLRGPAIFASTQCSTSLVAMHLACQSLMNGECDMALAGGVTVRVPNKRGYVYEAESILSSDGHCRPFDAAATGTVLGDGLGIVVLRRLEDAIAEGDTIRAVVRGWAVNNEGARRAGYSAPSVDGQAEVVAEALAMAEVSPEDIGYVEAHGTGTALGDPIELSALTQVYRAHTERVGFCGIGSVKGNIGHADHAAGIAGVIKTVLCMERGEMVPTLHYRAATPHFDIAHSPFFVVAEKRPWPAQAVKRAAVSSLGLGGTNAHVVLEEAPAPAVSSTPARKPQLVVLSAKSKAALETAASQWAEHLESHPELPIADVAYTSRVGRKALRHRLAVAAASIPEAVAALRRAKPAPAVRDDHTRSVIFGFPGQGTQQLGMARGLYDSEPAFRAAFDRSRELSKPHLGVDLAEVVFADDKPDNVTRLQRTLYTQPAVFAVSFALAELWRSIGVEPAACIGHSLGEYVAACVAGVMSHADALRIVCARARLMDSVETGAMLVVPRGLKEVEPLLGGGVELAAHNGPELTVVAGPVAAVEAWAAREPQATWGCRRLPVSHAFHTAMMDPILQEFERAVSGVKLNAPRIPYVSNLTGTWIKAEEATDPSYYLRHLRSPVRFAEGVATLCETPGRVVLEVGPGESVSALVRAQLPAEGGHGAVASLPRKRQPEAADDQTVWLAALGSLWASGVDVAWARLTEGETRRRVPLPTYPFERRRFWLEPVGSLFDRGAPAVSSSDPLPAITHERDVDPRARAEKELVAIWCDLLGVDTVGVDDNFMELGGHSLVATQLVRQVREQTGIALSLREFLESPTIAGILGKMTDGGVPDAPALEAIQPDTEHAHDPFPLTDVQAAYWVGRSGDFQLGGIATHIYREVELRGFDVAAAERALRKLIARHGMMRAIVQRDGTQRILPEVPDYMVARMDLRRTDAWEEELLRVRGEMSHQVRAADQWPLWEVRAALLPDDRVRLFMSIDMLLLDAKSIHQLAREWFALYAAPDLELPPVRVSFRDYVVTLERLRDSGAFAPSEEYWRARLDDLPGPPELPLLTAELTKPRFRRLSGVLPSELWEKLKARAARAKVSPSGLLAAVYADVLGAFSTSPKFTINLTLFDTLPIHPDMPRVCGDFTSLTLLAVDVRSAATFEERALRVQQQLWEDLDHRAFGGVRVMRELRRRRGADVSMPVVFTSTLGIGSGARTSDPADQVTKNAEIVYALSQTPQVWLDATVSEGPDGLGYAWNALEELFPDGFLDAMFEVYGDLIRRLATDEAAWQEAGQLPPRDQLALMAAVNDTAEPIPAGLLHEGALRRALEQPGQLAIVGTGYRVTYGELASAAAAVASALEQRGVVPGQLVAIVLPKGWEQVAGVLGVLSAGAAYVPIDPDLPPERQSYLLTNADVTMAVTNREVADNVAWPSEVGRVLVDEVRRSAPSARHSARPRVSPSDLAYVLYTSGSTGLPKGVMISHEGALNTVEDINRRFALCAEDRILALSALSFDLSVYDIFGTLAAGGTLVMPNPSEARDPEAWARLTEANTVTVWNSVPALMEMFVEYLEGTGNAKAGRSLRTVFLSGDWIPITLPERVRRIAPKTKVLSGGGATEASIWSVIYPIDEIDPAWRSIPYGKPLVNQTTHVLGDNLQPCPVWVPGEIYIGGIGVGLGYWRDPERSAKSFITHRGERLYRTGDFGRYLPGGDIEILGRQDSQVKIGGHRVELGEIEITLAAHPAIDTAVVCAPRSASGGRRLHAHVVIRPGQARPTTQELQTFLAGKLPAYMVPRQISPLDKLPLTDRGKIDRKTLESLAVQGGAREEASAAAETSTASTDDAAGPIAALVSRVLGYPVGHDDNLIELGADSVSMVRIVNAMERELRFRPRIVDVFRNPTVRGLVNLHAASTQQVATPNRPASSGIDKILQELKVGGSEPVDPEARARFKVDRFAQLRRRHAEQATAIRLDEGPTDETLRAHLARRSTRRFSTAPVPLSELSRLLTGLRQLTVGGAPKYRYASAGGLYPVVTYLFAKPGRVEGLSAGSYYYDAVQHRLVEVSKSAPNGDCYSAGMGFLVNRPVFESAAFGLFLVVQLGAIAPIYDQASLKFAAIEVGAMAQLLEMEAGRAGMGLCQIGAFDERAVAGNLGLAASEFVFHHLLGGGLDGDAGTPGQPDGSAEYDEFEV